MSESGENRDKPKEVISGEEAQRIKAAFLEALEANGLTVEDMKQLMSHPKILPSPVQIMRDRAHRSTSSRAETQRQGRERLDNIDPEAIRAAVINLRRSGQTPSFSSVCIELGETATGGLFNRLRFSSILPRAIAQHAAYRDALTEPLPHTGMSPAENIDVSVSDEDLTLSPQQAPSSGSNPDELLPVDIVEPKAPRAVLSHPGVITPVTQSEPETELTLRHDTQEEIALPADPHLRALVLRADALLKRMQTIMDTKPRPTWVYLAEKALVALRGRITSCDNKILDLEEGVGKAGWNEENIRSRRKLLAELSEFENTITDLSKPILG